MCTRCKAPVCTRYTCLFHIDRESLDLLISITEVVITCFAMSTSPWLPVIEAPFFLVGGGGMEDS